MKKVVAGIVAHVDAGKTTLSEAMLYRSGSLRKLGRVDKGDAFLDPDDLEKKRGITIFSHQAHLNYGDLDLTLLDTPGHIDFSAQTEQVLSVLDYAILVISATDGVQGYTKTLWSLLERYQVPAFIFVNKMDVRGEKSQALLTEIQSALSTAVIDFADVSQNIEEIAVADDDAMNEYLENETLSDETIEDLIAKRKIFPCFFGSALKMDKVEAFLKGVEHWSLPAKVNNDFGAKIFKISYDDDERLSWVRVTGGILKNKQVVAGGEKANQIRVYNGAKYELVPELHAGDVAAITGLSATYLGQGLGDQSDSIKPAMQPVLNYAVNVYENDVHECLTALKKLEDEDRQLHVHWSEQAQQIRVQIMGEMQLEVLQQLMKDRFGLEVSFEEGKILYKETITDQVEGVGHFEPLRHYAEVHLLMQPGKRGSGLTFTSNCSLDVLASNWQHQVLSNLQAKEHLGVLIGAPLTDVKITLVSGKASNVHSVGGDFKEATWRAVRQGLMMLQRNSQCQILEPWYDFRLMLDSTQVGHAMSDIQKMHGEFESPEDEPGSDFVVLTGQAPVSEMKDYAQDVRSYTHGQGSLELTIAGYFPCHDQDQIIENSQYQPKADLENTPDSVFCAHGAGYSVNWDDVPNMAHVPYQQNGAKA